MLHPDTKLEFIDSNIGHGVVATQLIPAGTIEEVASGRKKMESILMNYYSPETISGF